MPNGGTSAAGVANKPGFNCLVSCVFTKKTMSRSQPSEEFELTTNSLGAHIETHGKLILRTLSYLTVNSLDDSHCQLAVTFLGVYNPHSELAGSYS